MARKRKGQKKSSLLSNIILVIGVLGMLTGGYILGTTLWGEYQRANLTKEMLGDVTELTKPENFIHRSLFAPSEGDRVGMLEIPGQGMAVPLVDGVREADLYAGAGHIPTTHWPTDQGQIFIAGHRNTEFKVLQNVQVGDEIIMRMPYGVFTYRITQTNVIVNQADNYVIDSETHFPNDQLVLMTCYPFTFGADLEERFLVYAELVPTLTL